MDRYAFLADLVTLAADCVGNAAGGCQYEVFVSPGEPPADCSHVAAYWTGSSILPGSDKCLIKTRETFAVSLNRCCLKNIGEEFDAGLEDDDARCFVTDFGAMFECLVCGVADVLKPYVRTCQDVIVKVAQPDRTASGGCYGGMVEISFVRLQPCCPPPAPPPLDEFTVTYNAGNDTLVVVSNLGFDFTPVVTINYAGNGNGQIQRPPHFTLDSPSQITVQQAAFFLNGGVLQQLDFFVGMSVAASWSGSVNLF